MPELSTKKTSLIAVLTLTLLNICSFALEDTASPMEVVVSVAEQEMALIHAGEVLARYPISTSKFGLGDARNSYRTPLGKMRICEKIGDNLAAGTVLKGRQATNEILPVNAPGRDPIVTRILWLEGLEEQNRNARGRAIYIHGTPEESRLGEPVSWGCIRMRSRDVMALYERVEVGTPVTIITQKLPKFPKGDPNKDILVASNRLSPEETSRITSPPPLLESRDLRRELTYPSEAGSLNGKTAPKDAMKGSILFSGITPL